MARNPKSAAPAVARVEELVARLASIEQVILASAEQRRSPSARGPSTRCVVKPPTARLDGLTNDRLVAVVDWAIDVVTPGAAAGAAASASRGAGRSGAQAAGQAVGGAGAQSPIFSAKASYVIIYRLTDGAVPDRAAAEAFARRNAVVNTLPFWREWVASAMMRAALPPVMMPIMKFGGAAVKESGGPGGTAGT